MRKPEEFFKTVSSTRTASAQANLFGEASNQKTQQEQQQVSKKFHDAIQQKRENFRAQIRTQHVNSIFSAKRSSWPNGMHHVEQVKEQRNLLDYTSFQDLAKAISIVSTEYYTTLQPIIEGLYDLDFDVAELDYQLTQPLVEQLMRIWSCSGVPLFMKSKVIFIIVSLSLDDKICQLITQSGFYKQICDYVCEQNLCEDTTTPDEHSMRKNALKLLTNLVTQPDHSVILNILDEKIILRAAQQFLSFKKKFTKQGKQLLKELLYLIAAIFGEDEAVDLQAASHYEEQMQLGIEISNICPSDMVKASLQCKGNIVHMAERSGSHDLLEACTSHRSSFWYDQLPEIIEQIMKSDQDDEQKVKELQHKMVRPVLFLCVSYAKAGLVNYLLRLIKHQDFIMYILSNFSELKGLVYEIFCTILGQDERTLARYNKYKLQLDSIVHTAVTDLLGVTPNNAHPAIDEAIYLLQDYIQVCSLEDAENLMLQYKLIDGIFKQFSNKNSNIVYQALLVLRALLKLANGLILNPFIEEILDNGHSALLEDLQDHKKERVRTLAGLIIKQFFLHSVKQKWSFTL